MKRERGVLRAQALDAKKRLAGGYWELAKEQRGQGEKLRTVAGETLRRGLVESVCAKSVFDDELYGRVAGLMARGIDNPLTHVIDHNHIKTLSQQERERYIFDLSKRVRECVSLWYNRAC